MSARREKKKRRIAKECYSIALGHWQRNRPPKIKFWAYRKWKRAMPQKEDSYNKEDWLCW